MGYKCLFHRNWNLALKLKLLAQENSQFGKLSKFTSPPEKPFWVSLALCMNLFCPSKTDAFGLELHFCNFLQFFTTYSVLYYIIFPFALQASMNISGIVLLWVIHIHTLMLQVKETSLLLLVKSLISTAQCGISETER